MIKRTCSYIMLLLVPAFIMGQEIISGLAGNPVVQEYYQKNAVHTAYKSKFETIEPLKLPFYDDFSEMTVYPDTSRWMDNEAYINDHFGYFPVNYGVATLDVLDATGNVYLEANPFDFIADHLTSKPIRLDALFDENGDSIRPLTPADSVYLSFYYQPQGRGDVPLPHDSLALEFGLYSGDTIFSHFDSTLVYGFNYQEAMVPFGGEYLPPGFNILPWETCDSIQYILQDTFFIDDSLMIPCDSVFVLDTEWTQVWSTPGDTLDSLILKNDVFFKYVTIPITDTNWLQRDFQFRFYNYGSISAISSWQSNTDHWHLDVVYLDHSRTTDDRFIREVRFVEKPGSLINDYTTMPYQHYAGDVTRYRRQEFPVYVNNNDSIAHVVTYNYFVLNDGGDTLEPFRIDPITSQLDAFANINVDSYQPFVVPPVEYFYTSSSPDTVDYFIHHTVFDNDSTDIGDTAVYHQKFRNYFSYDDGSAEAGYGLSPAGAKLAIRFRSEVPDTLRGIQMFFNKTFNMNNDRLFHLAVWNDNNGIPGALLYVEEDVRPEFTFGLNRFYNHEFREYVKIGVQDFYVGWIQVSNHNLNIGFDKNTDSRTRNFYDVSGVWTNSSYNGSIMIRPIIGEALSEQEEKYKSNPVDLMVYPNPPLNEAFVTIALPEAIAEPSETDNLLLRIYDICGRAVYQGSYIEKFPVSGMKQGFYIVNLIDTGSANQYSTKLLITK